MCHPSPTEIESVDRRLYHFYLSCLEWPPANPTPGIWITTLSPSSTTFIHYLYTSWVYWKYRMCVVFLNSREKTWRLVGWSRLFSEELQCSFGKKAASAFLSSNLLHSVLAFFDHSLICSALHLPFSFLSVCSPSSIAVLESWSLWRERDCESIMHLHPTRNRQSLPNERASRLSLFRHDKHVVHVLWVLDTSMACLPWLIFFCPVPPLFPPSSRVFFCSF